jgi:hypothetical protein
MLTGEAVMRPSRLSVLGAVVAVAACDGTGRTVTGVSQGGGGIEVRALAFTVQPSTALVGDNIIPAIEVAARDTLGNTDVSFTGSVTVALGTNPSGAFLQGTKAVAAVFGVARFGELRINRLGTGFTLVATASGASSATSAAFDITAP